MARFEPRGAIEKPKDRKKVMGRLWHYLYQFKWMLLLAFILMLTSNLLQLYGPKLSGWAIDAIGTEVGKVDFDSVFF